MKKLMGLLFEEEEVIEEEEVYEDVAPTPLPLKREEKKVVREQHATEQVRKPVQAQSATPKPLLSSESIDGLQIPNPHAKVVTEEPKPESKKISMNVDELVEVKQVVKQRQEAVTSSKKKTYTTTYEFTPVISPIFGVDEKDAEAIIPTSPKKKVGDSKIGTVISPMYGIDKTAEPNAAKLEAAKSTKATEKEIKAERDMINLTLDDILARTAALSGKKVDNAELEEEEYSEKKVINSRNMSLFDDENE
ncbi:hypothetical protein [Anaerorhabdus sp.]|jgi:hypothetical protein|uniref:hypothetical protein n=1 Tax=Anaerorhabdus sp. TaxID=1872524 RepID=UPI002FCC6B10